MSRTIVPAALAAFVLAGALLTGCDSKTGSSANPPQPATDANKGPGAIVPTLPEQNKKQPM